MAINKYYSTRGDVSDTPFSFVATSARGWTDNGSNPHMLIGQSGGTWWMVGHCSAAGLCYGTSKKSFYGKSFPYWPVSAGTTLDLSSGDVSDTYGNWYSLYTRTFNLVYLCLYHPTSTQKFWFDTNNIETLSEYNLSHENGKQYALNNAQQCPVSNTISGDYDCSVQLSGRKFTHYDNQIVTVKEKRSTINVKTATSNEGTLSFTRSNSTVTLTLNANFGYRVNQAYVTLKYYLNGVQKTVNKTLFTFGNNVNETSYTTIFNIDDWSESYYTNDYEISGVFIPLSSYPVTIGEPSGVDNGTISVELNGGTISENASGVVSANFFINTNYTLKAVVKNPTFYKFTGWYKDGELLSSSPEFTYYQTSTSSCDIIAQFDAKELFYCNVKISDNTNNYRDVIVDSDTGVPTEESNASATIAPGCFAVITPEPTTTENGVPKWTEQALVFTATAATGWKFVNFNIQDQDSSGHDAVLTTNPAYLNLLFNGLLKVNFERKKILVGIEAMHSTSTDKKSNRYITASYESAVIGGSVDNIRHGDTIRFVANRGEYLAGHEEDWFAGFFDAEGNLVDAGTYQNGGARAIYEVAVTEDTTLYANAKVNFVARAWDGTGNNSTGNTAWDSAADNPGVIEISYVDYITGQTQVVSSAEYGYANVTVPLGSDITVSAIPNTNMFFGGWYLRPYSTASIPLPYDSEFTLNLNEGVIASHNTTGSNTHVVGDIVVEFLSSQSEFYIALKNFDFNAQTEDDTLGALSLAAANTSMDVRITEIETFDEYKQLVEEKYSSGQGGGATLLGTTPSQTIIEPGHKYYKVIGTINSIITAVSALVRGFVKWRLAYLKRSMQEVDVDGSVANMLVVSEELYDSDFSTSPSASLITNKDWVAYAEWGDLRPVKITLSNGIGYKDLGIQYFKEHNDTFVKDDFGNVSCDFMQESYITIEAFPYNGYKFDGWYLDEECAGIRVSDEQRYTFKVEVQRRYYAKYVQESNAIFEWDGDTSRKTLSWRSRRYVFDVPISFNSVRLYAEGYPTDITIYASQSPDDDNPRSATRPLMNQNPARLPLCRAEKYIEVEVKSQHSITNCTIATSMGGLCQR